MRNVEDDKTVSTMLMVSRLSRKAVTLYDAGEPERAYFMQSEATSLAMEEIDRLADLLDTLTSIDNDPEPPPCVATSKVVRVDDTDVN